MDFFQHQETARRKTGLLIFYFATAVVLIVVLAYAILATAFLAGAGSHGHGAAPGSPGMSVERLWDPGLFALVSLGTLTLVGGGSLYRIASLSGGGHTVAELLGGRLLTGQSQDLDERKILNVVEEMAIASGTPVPPVYLMENEEGINAFAAGFTAGDAVIGVTRGCIRTLSRDELQGVIAHEFSHILNGDMKLNIRLIGVLYGILLISMTGWLIFRSTAYSSGIDTRRDNEDRRGGNPWPLVGLALYVLGYVGVLFGNLIKAAVSRQREFLADASAVQFTRNPGGIAGALKKIGALSEGSKIESPEAQETSHLFFGEATGHLFSFMATHPPLAERIRRIDPSFDGDFSQVQLPESKATDGSQDDAQRKTDRAPLRFNPAEMIGRIGTFDPQQIAYATQVLESLPPSLREVFQTPYGARAIVFALLLDRDNKEVREAQLHGLAQHAEPDVVRLLMAVLPQVSQLAPEARLPLVDLVVPVLRQLSPNQFARFSGDVNALIQADARVSLFEFALQRLLLRHLASHFGATSSSGVRYKTLEPLVGSIQQVLGALAAVGHSDPGEIANAYSAGVQQLGWSGIGAAMPRHDLDLRALDLALSELDAAAGPLKKKVLSACAACIAADGRVTVEEAELLRAIADSLGCPVPIPRS